MCGITGWIDFERDLSQQQPTLKRMADTLRKRGPDAEGFWLTPRAALAHRRLIVLDPESGAQPMILGDDGRRLVITFNGEIYNFSELRRELESAGCVFRTRSDTEVILHAYAVWGERCVQHLNGIFAFGIWDEAAHKLFLARDHLGVKPLYFSRLKTGVVFGSEIKALLAHPEVRPIVDADGLAHVFTAILSVPGYTVYRDIEELKPGCTLAIDPRGSRTTRYWQLQSRPHEDDLDTTVAKIRALLVDIVRRQLVADVPVATMLSGGLDSSGVTALAAREFRAAGKTLSSYSIDFEDQAKYFTPNVFHLSLDTPWALKVAAHAKTSQHTVVVNSEQLLDNLLVQTFAHDYPGMGQMETSLYLLCCAIKRDATVALSGESADEVFGGYSWFFRPEAVSADTFPWLAFVRAAGERQSYLSADALHKAQPLMYIDRRYREAKAEVPRLVGEAPDDALRRELFYHNITRFLPMLLDRKDRMSMAAGLEVRVPFCDHRLVDYMWNVPWSQKSVDDIEKGVLRRAFADVLPHDALYRRKSPYPLNANPLYSEGLRRRALTILEDPNAAIRPFFDVAQLVARAKTAAPSGGLDELLSPFERIIQLEEWLTSYKIEVV